MSNNNTYQFFDILGNKLFKGSDNGQRKILHR